MKYTEKLAKLCWGCLDVIIPLGIVVSGFLGFAIVSHKMGDPHPLFIDRNEPTDKSMAYGAITWKVERYFRKGNKEDED